MARRDRREAGRARFWFDPGPWFGAPAARGSKFAPPALRAALLPDLNRIKHGRSRSAAASIPRTRMAFAMTEK